MVCGATFWCSTGWNHKVLDGGESWRRWMEESKRVWAGDAQRRPEAGGGTVRENDGGEFTVHLCEKEVTSLVSHQSGRFEGAVLF
jgi:hypothetical protein